MFMQKTGPQNNRNFGNRSFNDGFSNQNNQSGNFYDDFDLNEFTKNITTLERLVNNNRGNFNSRQNFPTNSSSDNNFGSPNWMRNQDSGFSPRGGNMNTFGAGRTNTRFNTTEDRNFSNQEDGRSGQHCIHMRGLPYYTDEMDVFNVSFNT